MRQEPIQPVSSRTAKTILVLPASITRSIGLGPGSCCRREMSGGLWISQLAFGDAGGRAGRPRQPVRCFTVPNNNAPLNPNQNNSEMSIVFPQGHASGDNHHNRRRRDRSSLKTAAAQREENPAMTQTRPIGKPGTVPARTPPSNPRQKMSQLTGSARAKVTGNCSIVP